MLNKGMSNYLSYMKSKLWSSFSNLSLILLIGPKNILLTYLRTYLFTYLITYLLIYFLIYSMEQIPSLEASWLSVSQEIPHILRNPNVHYRVHKWPPPVPIQSISSCPWLTL